MLKLYTDAATKGNPGPSGIGFVLSSENIYQQIPIPLEKHYSNHEAEFIALVEGLKFIQEEYPKTSILQIYSDSKIVVSAVTKSHVKNSLFQPYLKQIQQLLSSYELYLIEWIPDSKNKGADNLARQALQKAINRQST